MKGVMLAGLAEELGLKDFGEMGSLPAFIGAVTTALVAPLVAVGDVTLLSFCCCCCCLDSRLALH